MPSIVACPACHGRLRVTDELMGRPVRCPVCNTVFSVAPEAPAPVADAPGTPPEPRPAENGPLPRLSLDDDLPVVPPPSSGQTPGLVGAVELEPPAGRRDPATEPERGSVPLELPERAGRPGPPRLTEKDDDLTTCAACGKHVHRDARRCYHCGERLTGDGDDGRRRARAPVRRDCEPHRAGLVLTLGVVSLVLLAGCGPVGLALGIAAWVMGQADLHKMRAGEMDPEGLSSTQAGWVCGILGTLLNLLWVIACIGFWGLVLRDNDPSFPPPKYSPPPRVVPAPQPAPAPQWNPPPPPPAPRRNLPPPPRVGAPPRSDE
jgi:predicted Zn finger-like uncharacterized protein